MKEFEKIWKDQRDFNKNFFPAPETFDDMSAQTKELILHMMSECDELLRATSWKIHRRNNNKPNPEQVREELTDIFKYWISLCQVWGVSPKQAVEDYWRKSMVVRQRYSEEFVMRLSKHRIALFDIDGVIADYCNGFLSWLIREASADSLKSLADRARNLVDSQVWMCAESLKIGEGKWQELKHRFRVTRGKVYLPVFKDSLYLLDLCRQKGFKIVLLTSRPIDRYPNIYTDTLEWLNKHSIPFDAIWWSSDKDEMLLSRNLLPNIDFMVEDNLRYADQMANIGVKVYLINRSNKPIDVGRKKYKRPGQIKIIKSLEEVKV